MCHSSLFPQVPTGKRLPPATCVLPQSCPVLPIPACVSSAVCRQPTQPLLENTCSQGLAVKRIPCRKLSVDTYVWWGVGALGGLLVGVALATLRAAFPHPLPVPSLAPLLPPNVEDIASRGFVCGCAFGRRPSVVESRSRLPSPSPAGHPWVVFKNIVPCMQWGLVWCAPTWPAAQVSPLPSPLLPLWSWLQ